MAGYGFLLFLLYVAAVVYFFVLLSNAVKALERIAAALERGGLPYQRREQPPPNQE